MPNPPTALTNWVDLIWKVATPVGLFVVLWMNSRYVTREEFQAAAEDIKKIQTQLITMSARGADDRQDVLLADHEVRLRTLEKPKS